MCGRASLGAVAALAAAVAFGACPGDMGSPRKGDGAAHDVVITLSDGALSADQQGSQEAGPPDVGQADTPGPVPAPDSKPWPTPDVAPWTHDVGKSCTTNADCMFNICATNTHTGQKFCTMTCDPCTANPCPSGSGCQNAGLAYICAPGYPNAPCPTP